MIDKITPQIAALYLGQKCEYPGTEGRKIFATLTGVGADGIETTYNRKKNGVCGDIIGWEQKSSSQKCFAGVVVLHLRRLESMTEDEARELYHVSEDVKWGLDSSCLINYWLDYEEDYYQGSDRNIGNPSAWLYLLSKGFDLFGLINAGLAKEI